MGERVGIPWLGHTCGVCPYCVMHRENLCDHPLFTGFTRDGGYRDRDDRRCALRVPARRGRQRRGAGPLALRRPDRLAVAGDRRRRQKAWALRLRRGGPYPGAGREMAGALGVCLHAAGRSRHSDIRPKSRRGMGGRIRRDAAGAARCRDHLRARWRLSFPWR